jgi:hypothetical protein
MHESLVLLVEVRQILQIVAIADGSVEILEVDLQAGIQRIAPQVNDARLRKQPMHQP